MKLYYLITLLLLLPGCRFLSTTEELVLELPKKQGVLLAGSIESWNLRFQGREGECIEKTIPGSLNHINLIVEQGIEIPVTLEANLRFGDVLFSSRPAGFIYPYDCKSYGRGAFSWERGFPADVLLSASRVLKPGEINIQRLLEQVEDRAGESGQWNLDYQLLIDELADGDLSVYDIRLKRERDVELALPEGLWFSENPLSPSIESLSFENEVLVSLCAGIHRFVHPEGMVLEVFIESDGSYDYLVY